VPPPGVPVVSHPHPVARLQIRTEDEGVVGRDPLRHRQEVGVGHAARVARVADEALEEAHHRRRRGQLDAHVVVEAPHVQPLRRRRLVPLRADVDAHAPSQRRYPGDAEAAGRVPPGQEGTVRYGIRSPRLDACLAGRRRQQRGRVHGRPAHLVQRPQRKHLAHLPARRDRRLEPGVLEAAAAHGDRVGPGAQLAPARARPEHARPHPGAALPVDARQDEARRLAGRTARVEPHRERPGLGRRSRRRPRSRRDRGRRQRADLRPASGARRGRSGRRRGCRERPPRAADAPRDPQEGEEQRRRREPPHLRRSPRSPRARPPPPGCWCRPADRSSCCRTARTSCST